MFFLTGLFLSFIFYLPAQTLKNFSSVGGKKDLGVTGITQSAEDYIWLATKEGLLRFNGKSYRFYREEDGLADQNVTAVFSDSKNRIWAGHHSGKISIINKEKLFEFQLNSKLSSNEILNFYEDKNGVLYIATHGSGIYIWDGIKLDSLNSSNGLSDDIIYTMSFDGENSLWIGTDAGINILSLSGPRKIAHYSTKDGLPDNIVRCIKKCYDRKMIIGMQDSGLCYYDLSSRRILKDPYLNAWNYGAVTTIENFENGNLIIGTEANGFITIDNGRIKITDIRNGLISNQVSEVFVDREKNIWVATPRGICLQYQQRHSFINISNGLSSDNISCIYADEKETVWAGSDKGISEIFPDETGNLKVINLLQKLSQSGAQISCILQLEGNKLLLGTYGSGILVLDTQTGKTKKLATLNVPSNENISFICKDAERRFWVSTLGGGIMLLDETGAFIKEFNSETSGLGSDYVYQVFVDSKQRVWAAVDGGGLQILQGNSFIDLKNKLRLQSKTVYSITEDQGGNLWFVTSDDGVVKLNGDVKEVFNEKKGLRDVVPPVIAAVGNKIICVHNKGIDVIQPGHDPLITYFDISEIDIEPNLNAAYVDKASTAWIGTAGGLLKFRAYDVSADSILPAAFISKMKVDYRDYSLDSTNALTHRQNNLVFEFDANWLKAPDKIKFRYMLAGLEETWQQITGSKIAAYNNLPPGDYSFKVEACNEEGVWGSPTVYRFSIATPVWQRWWFWFLVSAVAITAVYFFMRFRLKSLQKQNLLLEHKVTERTVEIVNQNRVIEEKNKELEQLSLVASKTENVVLIMDATGKVEYINDSFTKLKGQTLEQLISQKGPTIFDISNNEKIREIIAESVREKKSVVYESPNMAKDGRTIWESSTLTPIFDESGSLKKLIIIDTDVTERKRHEEIILQKNRDITDSINYAQKIQAAILPELSAIEEHLPGCFVLYLIKDIVSGDFYWFAHKDDTSIIAAVDCTGHGVPGAFMSIIGYNLLNQIVNERNISEPAAILTELNKGVIKALYKKKSDALALDGMDIAICKIQKGSSTIEYAGAMRPLWIVKDEKENKELVEIKPDKVPIGTRPLDGNFHQYVNHVLQINNNETFYIFTDGYADQFGGDKGRKLTTGRFKELLTGLSGDPQDIKRKRLLSHHRNWKGNYEQIDDILIIGIKL